MLMQLNQRLVIDAIILKKAIKRKLEEIANLQKRLRVLLEQM